MYMEQVHQRQKTKDLEKWQKAVKEKQPRMKTQYSRRVYPKEYANTVQLMTT
jgi:ribosomal protein S7